MKELIKTIRAHKNTLFLGLVFTVSGIGIGCAMVAHYFGHPFNWKWFVFFDCPLYVFVIWVFYKISPIIRSIIQMEGDRINK